MLQKCGALNELWLKYLPLDLKKMYTHRNVSQTDQQIRKCLHNFIFGFSPDCKCNDVCEETVFKADVDKINEEYPKNPCRIEVFFNELQITKITEMPAYDRTRFMADIGGLIGLLVGMSMLSVFEVLACFVLYLANLVLRLIHK